MPAFFVPEDPVRRRWPYIPPHQPQYNPTPQAQDFDPIVFIVFYGAILSVALLLACFEVHCLNRNPDRWQQERRPLNAAPLRNGYQAV